MKERIVIADDHVLYRELVRTLLTSVYPDATCVEVETFGLVMDICAIDAPSLLILDVFMPGMNGLVGVSTVISNFPNIPVLVCSSITNEVMVRTILGFGAKGYASKTMSADAFVSAVKTVLDGGIYVPEWINPDDSISGLSSRQIEILSMVTMGLSNKEIAYRTDIEISTVKFHIGAILSTLGLHGRQQLIAMVHDSDHDT